MEISSPAGPLPYIPDNLTIPQFIFDYQPVTRPTREHDVPWLVEDETGRKIDGEELRKRTFSLANGLKSRFCLEEGDVVLIFSRNHVDYPVVIWAVHRLGGIISSANPDFSNNELLYQLKETQATVLVVHPDSIETALSAACDAEFPLERLILLDVVSTPQSHMKYLTVDDIINHGLRTGLSHNERRLNLGEARTKLAFLTFSSGTTGRPKAVAIPHFSVLTNVVQIATHGRVNQNYCDWEDQRWRPGDVAIGVLPFYHIYGLVINIHFILFCAMSLVIVPKFNFVHMLKSIVRHRISHLLLVPPQIVLLCKHPAAKEYDLRRYIRVIMSGAAPLSSELTQQLFEMFPNAHIGQAYGMTETCTATTMWPVTKKRGTSGSGGQLLPGIVARVLKSDGTLAGYDEPGELVIKTPSVALCYANNVKETKKTFMDGWVKTGDEVKIDKNGEIWVLDRLKEIMKVKGFQVAPAELEGFLLDHSDVSAACVVGVPDDYSGEVPMAFVVLTADAAHRVEQNLEVADQIKWSIMKHVADNKVSYKHLAGGVEFVTAIPTSPSGKLLRRVLREKARELRKLKTKL